MAALGMTFLLSAAVNAVPPGTEDEIADRIKPYGVVARAERNTAPIVPEAVQPVTLAKVELSEGSEHVVEMLNMGEDGSMVFQPSVIKVSVGDTILFKATDLAHNSASIDGMVPEGAKSWAGSLSADISVTFDEEGIYVYQCDPHLVMAMVGVIQVGEPVNKEAIDASAEAMKAQFAMNADRLENYLSRL
jgi:pseudoazurin